jgi:PTH1 family peptidyl-tRNA hydrolase
LFLITGLGNPGGAYAFTRHNAGYMVIDRLARRMGIRLDSEGGGRGSNYLFASTTVGDEEVGLVKPLTFMNRSGAAVAPILEELGGESGFDATSLIVVCDDCDLPFGKLRVRKSGGAGGQRGLESIIEHTGSKDFLRVRMGIGRPGVVNEDDGADGQASVDSGSSGSIDDEELSEYVLSPFSKVQNDGLDEFIDRGADAVEAVIKDGVERAMNLYN